MLRHAALALALVAIPTAAAAQPAALPEGATTRAQPFVFTAGMSDVFEITSSQIALMHSQDADVRRFAQMMISHHTDTTNGVLAAAKRAQIVPPPPVLDAAHRDKITQLINAAGPGFDRTYWQQQLASHQAALALVQGYAANGDTPQLRAAAAATVPIVQRHLDHVRMMAAR